MSKNLEISSTLSLPIDAVTQKLALLGRTGSGKSYAATKLAEEMLDAGAQIVALDPVGIWYGLRTAYSIPVFGGLHGDIPLEVGGGALIADLIVDRRISAVVDVSQFESDADKARFARDFAARFYFRQKQKASPVHLFLEEAQEFVPQNPEKEEGRMLHAFVRIAKLGRNFGIGATLISQRPQEVNKKALNQTECLFCFQMTGPQERKTIAGWATSKGVDEDLDEILPGLEVGQARVWSPQWLRISQTIKIAKKKTADVSSTPKHGAKPIKAKDLRPVDLEALREKMAATVERAKAEDPKELRGEIAKLKRSAGEVPALQALIETQLAQIKELSGRPIKLDPKQAIRATEVTKARRALEAAMKFIVEISTENFDAKLPKEEVRQAIDGAVEQALKRLEVIVGARQKQFEQLTTEAARVLRQMKAVVESDVKVSMEVRHNEPFTVTPAAKPAPAPKPAGPVQAGDLTISVPMQKILNTLASFEALGVQECDRNQIALFSGASPTSSSYANNLSALSSAGLIVYPSRGRVQLTDAGRAVAVNETVFSSLEELHSTWIAKVGGACGKILRALIDTYPNHLTKEELAGQVGASPTSSSFANNLSSLRTLGVIDYPGRGLAIATPLLFPPI